MKTPEQWAGIQVGVEPTYTQTALARVFKEVQEDALAKQYIVANIANNSVIVGLVCNGDDALKEGLEKLSEIVGQKLEFKDYYPHKLNNGTYFQVLGGF